MGLVNLLNNLNKRTLKAKFLRAFATPSLGSNRLPAFTKTVTDVVGWLWSTAATLTPVVSTTVAKERAMRCTLRDVALAANMKNFEKEIR